MVFYDATGPAPSSGGAQKKYDHLKKGMVGSFLNVKGVEQVKALQKIAVEETRLGIPLIFWIRCCSRSKNFIANSFRRGSKLGFRSH